MKNEELDSLSVPGWPLPEPYLLELGRVAAVWSTLESFLNVCIGKLAGFNDLADPKPFILVNHASIPQKFDMLSTLCEQLAPQFPNLEGYALVVSQLRSAQKARNRFLHNGIAPNPESGAMEMAEGSARGSLKTGVRAVALADIRRAWVEIHLANIALYKLVLGRNLEPVWSRVSVVAAD